MFPYVAIHIHPYANHSINTPISEQYTINYNSIIPSVLHM